MFCPRCAAQNLDDAKFCRVCGTNFESVALGLVDNYHLAERENDRVQDPLERWLEARKKSVNKIATGIGMLVSSVLIGIALWLFSGNHDWIIIWTVLVGWMTCLGVISMVLGIAGLMETRFLRRQLGQSSAAGNQLVQTSALRR
jgi:membrane protein YqaA with SNARE-associated domain